MRYLSVIATGMLLLGMSMSSCTCQKAENAPPLDTNAEAFKARDEAIAKTDKKRHVAAPTVTPKAETPAAKPSPVADLPSDFPSEVPVYAGAKVDQVQDLPNKAHNVVFKATGAVSDMTRFYHEKLSKAGWNVQQQVDRPNHAFMTYKKGSTIANVTIADDASNPGHQVIAIMYEEEQPLPFDEF